MEYSSLEQNKVVIKLRKTPILLSKRSQYRLSDFAFGEWIIFENGEPKYFLNVFDELYAQIEDQLKPDAESYLTKQFKKKGLNLSLSEGFIGIPLPSKAEIVELSLRKLPLDYIS